MTNREIDALVAEKVMGVPMPPESERPSPYSSRLGHKSKAWSWSWAGGGYPDKGEWMPHPFSSEPSSSKQARDRMRELGWCIRVETWLDSYVAIFFTHGTAQRADQEHTSEEMAVALASLAALGVPAS